MESPCGEGPLLARHWAVCRIKCAHILTHEVGDYAARPCLVVGRGTGIGGGGRLVRIARIVQPPPAFRTPPMRSSRTLGADRQTASPPAPSRTSTRQPLTKHKRFSAVRKARFGLSHFVSSESLSHRTSHRSPATISNSDFPKLGVSRYFCSDPVFLGDLGPSGLRAAVEPGARASNKASGVEEVEGVHGENNHRAIKDVFPSNLMLAKYEPISKLRAPTKINLCRYYHATPAIGEFLRDTRSVSVILLTEMMTDDCTVD